MIGRKKAWVTFAVDQTTALEAIVLAKSLSKFITFADTVVFTTFDISSEIRNMLSRYFDAVILLHIPNESIGLTKEEFLKLSAWNLGMYSKCVVLNPKALVLKNSDEIFGLQDEIFAVPNGSSDSFNFSVFVMNPCAEVYQKLSKLAFSGQFHQLSDLVNYYIKSQNCGNNILSLPGNYNYNVLWNNELSLDEAKIVTFETIDMLKDKDNQTSTKENRKIVSRIWNSLCDGLKMENNLKNGTCPITNNDFLSQEKNRYKDAIAIVGYSCRFPGANNSNEFWELIKNGGDGISTIPTERLFDFQRDDPKFAECKAGFLKCPIDEFDAKFFGISPREASYMDPQQRLLVEVAWEALEDAAINPQTLKGSNTGVYSGVWTHDYERLITENTSGSDFHHVVLGNAFSATSARVSYFLGLNGPNIATESGCSSSMVALHLACNSLLKGETNLGLVLGANVMILQFPLSEIPILARDGHCKTFDEKADGFARAEGVAVLVLKRLPDALKNGDRIMALVRGSALSNEGTTCSFGTPSRLCQEIAIKAALKNSGVSPNDVDYVEAHGTGTPVGDPIEFAAISAGYAGKRERPLLIGSVKTNIGHTESAAGIAGLLKVIMSMENEVIPPHINLENVNPSIDLNLLPAIIPRELTPWLRNPNRKRIAGVSSFGISGTNVHAIIEEPPNRFQYEAPNLKLVDSDRSHFVLGLSAKSENALKDLSSNYVEFLKQTPNLDIGDLTFTANTGRAHLKHRLSVVGRNIEELQSGLNDNGSSQQNNSLQSKHKIAFLFTGQGSQYFGMAKSLYHSNLVFRTAFRKCCTILENNVGVSLVDVLWNEDHSSLLEHTIYSQLSIFSVEYSLFKLWESLGVKPEFILGHSVGEFAASVAAGILEVGEALRLLALRSQLIQNLPTGGMLAIHCSKETVAKLISEFLIDRSDIWLDIAVVNSEQEVVVAGNKSVLASFAEFCKSKDKKCIMLAASHAFHSRAMDAMLHEFAKTAGNICFQPPKCCYISGTTGNYLSGNEMNISYWQRHAREPVNFPKAVKTLVDNGCNCFIEIGAHPVLLALSMTNLPDFEDAIFLPSIRKKEENWQTFLSSVGSLYTSGFDIKWDALDKSILRKKIPLVNYPFQRQKYWIEFKTEGLGRPLHPLLGRKVVLANIKDIIYEHTWNLKDLSYFKDHQVAHTTILPGAAYLEIILAAGKDVLLENTKGNPILQVEDFVVECPLELEEDKKYKVQVIVSPVESDSPKFQVSIYLYQKLNGYNDEKGWKQYSSAFIKLCNEVVLENNNQETLKESYAGNIEEIKTRCAKENGATDFYKLAPEIGIYFGETFQSIETVWEGGNEALAKIPLPSKAGNISEYVYHPIVLDAMIQTFGLSLGKENAGLYLPVGVDSFSMLDCRHLAETEFLYAHAKWEQGKSQGTVALYNNNNVLLGLMKGLRLLRTSLGSFLNVINSQKNMLPGMFHEVWRVRDGPMQSRVDFKTIPQAEVLVEPLRKIMEKTMNRKLVAAKIMCDEIVCLDLISMFLENGWKPQVGETFDSESIMQSLLISYSHQYFFERILDILCEEGYFVQIDEKSHGKQWKVVKQFLTSKEVKERLDSLDELLISVNENEKYPVREVMRGCKEHIMNVLQGKVTAVSALFGTEGLDPLEVYTKCVEVGQANISKGRYLELALNELKSDQNRFVRIIEIGGGSAATTKQIIRILQQAAIPFRYTFTDISPHFFETAKKELSNFSGVDYKVLDIEKDPSAQGFCPNHYDIAVAANVIHATENLKTSIGNIRSLLAPSGLLLMQEMLTPVRPIDYIFGLLDGYWKFKDYDLRQAHPMVSKNVWDSVFQETGFGTSNLISDPDEFASVLVAKVNDEHVAKPLNNKIQKQSPAWIIFPDHETNYETLIQKLSASGKVYQLKNDCQTTKDENGVIKVCLDDYAHVKEALDKIYSDHIVSGLIYLSCGTNSEKRPENSYLDVLNISKYFATVNHMDTQIFFVTRGVQSANQGNSIYPNGAPIWGMCKSLANEVTGVFGKLIDLDPDIIDVDCESQEIFFELFDQDETLVCFRNRKRYVNRYIRMQKPTAPLVLPQGRYVIEVPKTKKINDISFRSIGKTTLGPDDVEVLVKAVALNFRDVFVILKPDTYFTKFEAVGSDFAGLIARVGTNVSGYKIGDEVFGISNSSSVASHVTVNFNMLLPKPKSFTFCDASTLPSVFLTAYHCLVTVANLKKDETILIHVASGGVGLIAIQIANYLGAKVIATAGSHRKRSYLKSIGVSHVFHSRDLSYGEEIQRVTKGRGVDVVLNSLTSQGFKETTLDACAQGARFVEMGKVNIWKNDDVEKRRPDVKYTIVDLETMSGDEMTVLVEEMKKLMDGEKFLPLPYSRFEVTCIKDALNYFLKAQHIGKIVVAMPEVKDARGDAFHTDMIFNSNATYLITGGLGGIGLEVAKWTVDSGAKNIVLVGRTAPNEKVIQVLKQLRGTGCTVLSLQVDVGNWEQCKKLFEMIKSELPPLRGVIHSAGALSDAVYTNQTLQKFETVFNAKISGGWNLHHLTQDLNLEHFVLFSSMAAIFGPIGQPNHAAANAFLDSLVHYRHSIGLPAQTINWGAWSGVGAATNTAYGKEGAMGVKPFTPNQGVAALKFIMTRPNLVQLGVIQLDVDEFKQHFGQRGNVLTELIDGSESSTQSSANQSSTFWNEINGLSLEERTVNIKLRLESIIRRTLKLPETEQLDEYQTFSEMGLDSLMAVEMRNKLVNMVGNKLSLNASSFLDFPTINGLSKYLAETTMSVDTSSSTDKNSPENKVDLDAIYQLVKKDSVLPDSIQNVGRIPAVAASQVRNILFTGATGRFGSYVLKDLMLNPQLNVVCLVRGKSVDNARKKLTAALKKFNILNSVNVNNLKIVVGNVSENRMGIAEEEYQSLSEQIDLVLHLAAKANHIEQISKYRVSKIGSDIRSVNVTGTLNVIKFASNIKIKRIVFASTFASVNTLTSDGFASEDFPENDNVGEGITMGYVLSKFVCEKLLKEAIDRGIPCTVIRYPTLIGDSGTGHFTVDTDTFLNFILLSCKMGAIPDIKGGWYTCPVDVASRLSLEILFNDKASVGVFNLLQTTAICPNDCVAAANRLGYKMKIVSEREFSQMLQDESKSSSWISVFTEAYGTDFMSDLYASNTMSSLAVKNKQSFYRFSEKFLKVIPNVQQRVPSLQSILHLYIDFANKSGISEKFGIHASCIS